MKIDYTNSKYTVGPIVSGSSKLIQSVKIKFETDRKPPEAIRRSKASMLIFLWQKCQSMQFFDCAGLIMKLSIITFLAHIPFIKKETSV